MHPYYGAGYQQRTYARSSGLHIISYDTATQLMLL